MSEYLFTAMRIDSRCGLSALLMMEVFDRLCPGTFDGRRAPRVRALAHNAWTEAGYCLDAPDLMPAGGCYSLVDEVGSAAFQLTCEREA